MINMKMATTMMIVMISMMRLDAVCPQMGLGRDDDDNNDDNDTDDNNDDDGGGKNV